MTLQPSNMAANWDLGFLLDSEEDQRFEQEIQNSGEFIDSLKDRIPKCTQNSTAWAVTVYKEWSVWRSGKAITKGDFNWPIPTLEQTDFVRLD